MRNEILDKQLSRIPTKVRFCKKCVVSNQRPRITFDKKGVCSACQYAYLKRNVIDWRKRERELTELLSKHRSKNGGFDVVVPVSGGKDSAYTAHILKHKHGMHPLCVTWAPHMYTDIGWGNFNNFVNSGFDVMTCFQNGILHRKLVRVAFEFMGDPFVPFSYGQKSFSYHIAVKFKIPLIFYGENGEVEYGGSLIHADKPHESPSHWGKFYFKGSNVWDLVKKGIKIGLIDKNEVADKTFELYQAPDFIQVRKLGVQMHWLSYYQKWVPQENYYYSAKYTGFRPNPDGRSEGTYSKYASLDDKLDGLHYYMGYIKFGIGRTTSDASHEIRDGHITREEGAVLVRRYDGEFPHKYFPEILEYLNLDKTEFFRIVDGYRPKHLWEKVNGEWKLKHHV